MPHTKSPKGATEVVPVPEHLVESLAAVRHGLRTPLNHIIGLSDLWIDTVEGDAAQAELRADLTHIRDAAWRLNAMLETLLATEGFVLPAKREQK
jgi:signal transduction histidine kinase